MKFAQISLFLLILALAIWHSRTRPAQSESALHLQAASNLQNVQKPTQINTMPSPQTTASSESAIEITDWLATEASGLDQRSFDPLAAEAEMIEKAKNLTTEEIQYLKEVATNQQIRSVANERILSVYVLSKAPNVVLPALIEIATQPLSNPGPHEAHSLDETFSMHEKALKRMAIDDFFRRAILSPELRSSLFEMIQSIQVPELKRYARDRYQQLFS